VPNLPGLIYLKTQTEPVAEIYCSWNVLFWSNNGKTSAGMPCNIASFFYCGPISEHTKRYEIYCHNCERGCRYFGTHFCVIRILTTYFLFTVEPGYNDIALCGTSPIASHILWHQLIPHTSPITSDIL